MLRNLLLFISESLCSEQGQDATHRTLISVFILDPQVPGSPERVGSERGTQPLDPPVCHVGFHSEDQKREGLLFLDDGRQLSVDRIERARTRRAHRGIDQLDSTRRLAETEWNTYVANDPRLEGGRVLGSSCI